MALSLRILVTIILALTLYSFTSTNARPLHLDLRRNESSSLVTRLKFDDTSTNCWESLFKLQSCSGEMLQFFYNGETYLGPDCCNAILIIVHDCWPAMLGSLGFNNEEVDILRGYCDAEEEISGPGPIPPGPTHDSESVKDGVMD
ncbi:Egg cell-secreted protein 1.1 [Bienertia sinuspersici]